MATRSPLESACAEVLRRMIALRGRSIEAVGRDAGYSRSYLSTLLRGRQRLTMDHIHTVLETLEAGVPRYLREVASELERLDGGGEVREPAALYGQEGMSFIRRRLREMAAQDQEEIDERLRHIVREELRRSRGED